MAATCLYRVFSGRTSASSLSVRLPAFRSFSAAGHTDDSNKANSRLRVAVVGGGAAGMTTALHLSPLVASGLIQGPIDVYEANNVKKSNKLRTSGHTKSTSIGGKQLYSGSGALGRDIGVGIWSTAWWPFLRSLEKGLSSGNNAEDNNNKDTNKNRQSYKALLKDLEACGSYVKDVGYRSPNGSWLVKSQLNASPYGINDLLHESSSESNGSKSIDNDDPALLFVREKDLLSCLRNAIKIEQKMGTVKYHYGLVQYGLASESPLDESVSSIETSPLEGAKGAFSCKNKSQVNFRSSKRRSFHRLASSDGLGEL